MVQLNPTQPSANPVINEPTTQVVTSQVQLIDFKKIVLLGPSASGKTTWFCKVRTGQFGNGDYVASYGMTARCTRVTSPVSGVTTIFDVWDIAGDDHLMCQVEEHFVGARGFVFFLDLQVNDENHVSGGTEIPLFLSFLKNHAATLDGSLPRVVFVANKLDLVPQENAEQIEEWLNNFSNNISENGSEFGITDFSILTLSVKNDTVEDLLAPLLQFV